MPTDFGRCHVTGEGRHDLPPPAALTNLSHHQALITSFFAEPEPNQPTITNLSRQCLHVPRTSPAPPKKITANIPIRQSVPRFRPQPLAWLPSAPTRRPPAARSFPSVPPSRIMRGASAVLTAESPASLWNPASLTKSTPIHPTPSYGSVLTKRYACCVILFCIRGHNLTCKISK